MRWLGPRARSACRVLSRAALVLSVAAVAHAAEPVDGGRRTPRPKKHDRQFRVLGLVTTRTFFASDGMLWGGGVRIGEEPLVSVGWTLDALYEAGEVGALENRYDLQTATLGGALFLYKRWSAGTARVGAGLRTGVTRSETTGTDGSGTSTAAPWGWPLAALSLSVRPVPSVVFEVGAEGGYVAMPVSAGGGDAAIRGAWFGGQLGIGAIP
jgi:hypothetical protein